MEGTKPAVPRRVYGAVIALEKAVVQLVVKVGRVHHTGILDQQLLKTGVGKRRAHAPGVEVQQQNDRMGRQDKVYEHRGYVDDVLDRVHGHPGPGTDMNVAVVQAVHRLVQRRPMQQPVNQEKCDERRTGMTSSHSTKTRGYLVKAKLGTTPLAKPQK